jgi:hypothetical protein
LSRRRTSPARSHALVLESFSGQSACSSVTFNTNTYTVRARVCPLSGRSFRLSYENWSTNGVSSRPLTPASSNASRSAASITSRPPPNRLSGTRGFARPLRERRPCARRPSTPSHTGATRPAETRRADPSPPRPAREYNRRAAGPAPPSWERERPSRSTAWSLSSNRRWNETFGEFTHAFPRLHTKCRRVSGWSGTRSSSWGQKTVIRPRQRRRIAWRGSIQFKH